MPHPSNVQAIKGLINLIAEDFDTRCGGLMLFDFEEQKLKLQKPAFNLERQELADQYVVSPDGEGNAARVFRAQKPYLTNCAYGDDKVIQHFVQLYDVNTLMTVPLIYEQKPIGVLHLINKSHGHWNAEDLKNLFEKANQVAPTMQLFSALMDQEMKLHLLESILADAAEKDTVYDFISCLENAFSFRSIIMDHENRIIYENPELAGAVNDKYGLFRKKLFEESSHLINLNPLAIGRDHDLDVYCCPISFKNHYLGKMLVIYPKDISLDFHQRAASWIKMLAWKLYENQAEEFVSGIEQYVIDLLMAQGVDIPGARPRGHHLKRWLERLGFRDAGPFCVITAEIDRAAEQRFLDEFARITQAHEVTAITGTVSDLFVALVESGEGTVEMLESIAVKLQVSFGVSNDLSRVEEVKQAFHDAKHALKYNRMLNKPVTTYKEIGFYSVLMEMSDSEYAKNFSIETIAPLLAYDKKNKGQLIVTLQEFFRQNSNQRLTARQLYIHLNTLRYRLAQVHELTGLNPRNFNDQFKLKLAIDLLPFLKKSR